MAYSPVGKPDESAFSEGTTGVVPVGGEFNDASADVASGQLVAARVTKKRAVHVNVRDSSGNEIPLSGAPSNPVVDNPAALNLAPGVSGNMDSLGLATTGSLLWQVDLNSALSFKAVIETLEGGVARTITTVVSTGGRAESWRPPHPTFVMNATASGTNLWRAVITNLDPAQTADFYTTFYYSGQTITAVASGFRGLLAFWASGGSG